MLVAAAWTAPLGCVVQHAFGVPFVRSIPMRQRYIAIVILSRSSQTSASVRSEVADSPPTSRIARTRRFGGLVAGQGLRWAGHPRRQRAALRRGGRRRHRRARRRDRARARQAARPDARRGDEDRPGALDRRLHRDPRVRARGVQATLATLRDDVPPLPFKKVEKLLKDELGDAARRRLRRVRARGVRGRLDRPGPPRDHDRRHARSRSRSSTRASPRRSRPTCATCRCCSRWSSASRPASTSRRSRSELRERIGDELDYEVEAQNHRAMARAWRGHPFALRARRSTRSSRAAACSSPSCSSGRRFEEVKQLPTKPSATASARSSSASSSARSSTSAAPPATRTPATTCCSTTAASASSTSG